MLLAATSGHLFHLLVIAGVAVGCWLAVLEILAVATRPREPSPGPAVLVDAPAQVEPPALVNFLSNHWAVGPEAASATLVDLAARHYLTIDEVGPDRFVCRLAPGPVAQEKLTPYEEQVLQRVRSLAADGVVPCEALATGTSEEAGAWRKRFDQSVVADAKARGLSRGRWGKGSYALLGVTAVAPAVAIGAALAASSAHNAHSSAQHQSGAGDAFWSGVIAWAVLMALTSVFRAQRETPAGSVAAAKWLGLREHLHADAAFPTLPPAAVAIWDRYLAYGAALGVAAGAVHALPMGPESDREAWSPYGGRWHLVRIHYPHLLRPGWGWHPAKAIAVSLLSGAAAFGVARVVLSSFSHTLLSDLRSARFSPLWGLSVGIMVVILGALAYAFVVTAKLLTGGLADLTNQRDVKGVVLRLRKYDERCYVAVDEGRVQQLWAWRVRPEIYSGLSEHAQVTGRVADQLPDPVGRAADADLPADAAPHRPATSQSRIAARAATTTTPSPPASPPSSSSRWASPCRVR